MDSVVELRNVVKQFDTVTAVDAVSFAVSKGLIVALLGPSGCGKTTTLRLIAGFERPDEGEILINGSNVSRMKPYERNIGLVFQDYALFPHLTVEQNIAFGMKYRNVPRTEIRRRTAEILSLVKLSGFEKRRPSQLSGGQQQRIALARAIVTQPAVLLLDEPLSNLDAKLRQELRIELKAILRTVGTTTIIVTHDQVEAMSVADHIIVMNDGHIEQEGVAQDLYHRPRSHFVAEFLGHINWFKGTYREEPRGGGTLAIDDGMVLQFDEVPFGTDRGVLAGVRSERIGISQSAVPAGDRRVTFSGSVVHIEYLGPDVELWVELKSGQRIRALQKNIGGNIPATGAQVNLHFGPEDCIVVPSDGKAS